MKQLFGFLAAGLTMLMATRMAALATPSAAPSCSGDILVGAGAEWAYSDTGVDWGVSWRDPGYDDAGWPRGVAQLGYGDIADTTVITYGPDANNKRPTDYFRRAFTVTDPSRYASLTLSVLRDDGAVAHLNGSPVFTTNMPAGVAVGYTTYASTAVGGADESAFFDGVIDAARLVTGVNVLAVEVHQANATSSDLGFDLQLCGQLVTGAATPTPTPTASPTATPTPRPTLAPPSSGVLRFASVGDFGDTPYDPAQNPPVRQVADMIRSWNPEFIVTVGDNSYCSGAQYDACVGGYYHDAIAPYTGAYGSGAVENRFWPALGNHDIDAGVVAYTTFFSLPGNGRYYDLVRGDVHFFFLNSDSREPDGNAWGSIQSQWFTTTLAASTALWKVVIFHHPSWSSGSHGDSVWMQWPFADLGVNAVLNGHDHDYERLDHGIPYFVNGAGGKTLYGFGLPTDGSLVRYNADYGAMLIDASTCAIVWNFINLAGTTVDTVTQTHPLCPARGWLPILTR